MAADSNALYYGQQTGNVTGADDGDDGFDFWGFLRRRKSFILVLAILGTGAGYLMFERQVPRYRSAALVQVIHSSADPRLENLLSERDLSDAPFVIASPTVLAPAVATHKLNLLPSFQGLSEEDTAARLTGFLRIRTIPGSNMIEIACEGTNPADTAAIANAVSEQYIQIQQKNYQDARVELEQLLTKGRDEILKELEDKEREYNEFRKKSKLTSDGQNPFQARHNNLLDEISRLRIQETSLKAGMDAFEEALKDETSRESLMLLVERSGIRRQEKEEKKIVITTPAPVENTQTQEEYEREVAELRARAEEEKRALAAAEIENLRHEKELLIAEKVLPLQLELDRMLETYGADHPKILQQRKKIESVKAYADVVAGIPRNRTPIRPAPQPLPVRKPPVQKEAPVQQPADAEEEEPEEDPAHLLNVYHDSLRQELQQIEKSIAELTSQAAKEEADARNLMEDVILDRNKTREMERLTQLFQEYITKIRETKVNNDIGGVRAQVLTAARVGYLIFPVFSQFLGMGAVFGAFLGLILGYAVEVADRSFRNPEDVLREFGMPIMGHIPFTKESQLKKDIAESSFDRMAVCFHQPRSRSAEAFRSVRTALCFSAQGSSQRVIQITSPTAGDGKSTLALNLSIALAISGKKTILIECDLRRPRVHKLSGAVNRKGIVDVLAGRIELSDGIQSTEVENLFVLPGGSRTKNPAELLVRPEFGQLLQVLREKFDYVIIDTPPVLVVTDPCGVAAQVDGVLVAMRLGRQTRDLGRRTIEQLRDVGAVIAGIVINGVDEGDTYGYGAYRYADYKGYSNGYAYEDVRKGSDAYYLDEEPEPESDSDTEAVPQSEAGQPSVAVGATIRKRKST
jgi:capsular exopolysaccharide synthesis family protein